MEGPEFILFGTTHLAGLAVIFAVMIALPKITNKYFSDKRELIGRIIGYLQSFIPSFRHTAIFILLLSLTAGRKCFHSICVIFP